jgi:hypothetical protein
MLFRKQVGSIRVRVMPRKKMQSRRVSEVGARHVPAVQGDDRARRRSRDRDKREVEAVCAALVGALVEAADTVSDRAGLQARQMRLTGPRSASERVHARRSLCRSRTRASGPTSATSPSTRTCGRRRRSGAHAAVGDALECAGEHGCQVHGPVPLAVARAG